MAITTEQLICTLVKQRAHLMAYIVFLVSDNESAENIFQEISTKAYQKCDSIENLSHLMGWLRIAARNESLKAIKKRATERIHFDSSIVDQLEPIWDKYDNHDPKLECMLRKCLEQMPPAAKNIVKLKYYEGLRGDIIAKTLNMKLNSVYVSLTRIHGWLAECVKRKYSESNA